MSKELSSLSNSSIENYFKIALSFSTAKLGLLLIRHPIHVIQTNKQAFQELTNLEIITHIYKKNGVKGFYKSTPISILKILVAESYRGILMVKIPKMIQSHIPKVWIDSHPKTSAFIAPLVAGPAISLIDAAMICPLVRMATLQITTSESAPLKNIYKTHLRGNVLRNLYRGYIPLLVQTSFLWTNFLIIDDLNKSLLSRYSNKISYPELVLASIVGGSAQTLINAIPDTIRIQMQKVTSRHLNVRNTTRELIKQHGVRSLFSATPHKLVAGIVTFGYKSILRYVWTNSED